MSEEKPRTIVHIVSHGPHCLDGVAAAVAVARFHRDATVIPCFASNQKIDETILGLRCQPSDAQHEIWITDISWTTPEADDHLRRLAERGVRVYWIDHHRTAIERVAAGGVNVPFADKVVRDDYAASKLTYDYVTARQRERNERNQALEDLAPLIAMADDNDRWLHKVPGSRELAMTVRAMGGMPAYEDLLTIDRSVTYTPRMRAAQARLEGELQRSFAIADASRVSEPIAGRDITLVAAMCDGHPSEIADKWGKQAARTVFALFDAKSLSVSLRRSPDCEVDLSHLARAFGGGGHAAAAGCELPELRRQLATELAKHLGAALTAGKDR
ncbi:MAG TPA: DHHA1 domain-containing protein [Candidatus Kryptonia bacterium]|nr:DHHA1 domain-containing protein [Candidatus Kryptonia bacterium]